MTFDFVKNQKIKAFLHSRQFLEYNTGIVHLSNNFDENESIFILDKISIESALFTELTEKINAFIFDQLVLLKENFYSKSVTDKKTKHKRITTKLDLLSPFPLTPMSSKEIKNIISKTL